MGARIKRFVLKTRERASHPLYAQVLVVVVAFALMVALSYRFMGGIEHRHMLHDVNTAISKTQSQIAADLMEPETFLGSISETVRIMILQGEPFEVVATYLNNLTGYILTDDRLMSFSEGAYGHFDVYGGRFYAGIGWSPPPGYDVRDRPWFKAAEGAGGAVAVTEPYPSVALGKTVITFARRLFDDGGKPLAVICLDVTLDRIRSYAVDAYVNDGGYGILLDGDFNVLAHPSPAYIGRALRDLNDGAAIEAALRQGKEITERKATDYRGDPSILFMRQLDNGWYMAILTYAKHYFSSVRRIAQILVTLGSVLTLIVSAILVRIIAAKYKSDEVTEAKIREADISSQSASILENILNGLDAMIYVTAPQTGEILFINDRMKSHYHIEGECVGQLCYKVLQEGLDARCSFCPCHKLDKDPGSVVEWVENSSLTGRVYRNTDCYIEWPGGMTVHLQHSVDITELNEAKDQAIQASSAKSNFLARVSHEVRTPLNAILGITEIQLQNEGLPPDAEEALDKIYNSGYMLLSIINDILDLSKIEAGKLELMPVKYDVPSLINDTVYLNIMRFDSKPIEFYLELDETIPLSLSGDELRIKQILNNLLSNAFKYTEGGAVTLAITAEPPQEGGGDIALVFSVSDTGQGMSPDQLERLFDEYTRFNNEANRATEGTGLGMSITRHLIRMMGGVILVESEQGKGSKFTVKLPQQQEGGGTISAQIIENLQQFRSGRMSQIKKAPQIVREYMPYGRVMVVDDVETNLYVAKGLMAPYGLLVDTASSGFEAVDKIKAGNTYDVIFMDHFMPKKDGIETTHDIRRLGYAGSIVALTANAVAGQAEAFMANGFDGFMSKPIDIRQLNDILNKMIRNKHPAEAAQSSGQAWNHAAAAIPDIAEIFARDGAKAVAALEGFQSKQGACEDGDVQGYIITVHAMKSALANIGEKELSDFAGRLEQAGRDGDSAAIAGETGRFLDSLRAVVEKNRPKDKGEPAAVSDADRAFLAEKLAEIKNACAGYNKKSAKEAVVALKKKAWPRPVKDMLNAIAEHLLHSDFEEAAKAVENFDMP